MTADDPRFQEAFPMSARMGLTPAEVARELRLPLAHLVAFLSGERFAPGSLRW